MDDDELYRRLMPIIEAKLYQLSRRVPLAYTAEHVYHWLTDEGEDASIALSTDEEIALWLEGALPEHYRKCLEAWSLYVASGRLR